MTLVVNFDAPSSVERYMHRIGRTGRAGRDGLAYTFLSSSDSDIFFDLRNALESSGNKVPHELAAHPAAHAKPGSEEAARFNRHNKTER